MHQTLLSQLMALPNLAERTFVGGAALFRFHHRVQVQRTPYFVPCLIAVLAGEKHIKTASGEFICKAGDWFTVSAGTTITFTNVPDPERGYFAAVVIAADASMLQRFRQRYAGVLPAQLDAHPLIAPDTGSRQALHDYISEILITRHDKLSDALVELRWEALWLALARQGVARDLVMAQPGRWRERVVWTLYSNVAADWHADDVARKLALSESSLRRRLRDEGVSFSELLLDVRMERALAMVMDGSTPIQRIAEACGYTSPSRFAAAFRQRFGLSPLALRASFQTPQATHAESAADALA
ncbi:AraC family transcriptional regulator [Silvimonas iriomotensis]|uniref:AraC family transcriptional regulator n=1 Tax=Silvimonas iriomotensis TaxID=449662 RepID=A0ABQ2P967_9NEIS|nr:AraC family transcriptional regulator [Silvimonas iriomotensis]GGP21295.1 AraC family transcriptional regulator [Silvimonas iriomotensis]